MSGTQEDLNTVITAAVNARVEAAVAEALSGGDLITQYVAAAMNETVVIKKTYPAKDVVTTFMKHALTLAFQGAVQRSIAKVLMEEQAAIEESVRKAIRSRAADIGKQLAEQVATHAVKSIERSYGIDVRLKFPGE